MDPLTAVAITVGFMLILLVMRAPVAFALITSGILGVALIQGLGVASRVLGRIPYETPSSYVLIILPMFIAMGIFAQRSAIAEDGFRIAARALRSVPGGLGIATVFACAGFAAVSGSSVATVATMGPMSVREMRKHGYSTRIAAGIVGASGTLGVLIPPSIILVLYGIVTGESIGRLLIAGIIPGILSAVLYGGALVLKAQRDHRRNPIGETATAETQAAGLRFEQPIRYTSLLRIAILFTIVVGGIYSGFATATEAASLGALAALIMYLLEIAQRRDKKLSDLRAAIGEAVSLSSMTFALLIGGAIFTYFLVAARVPAQVTQYVVGLEVSGAFIVVLLLLAFVPLGMFLDPLSIVLVAVPLAYPAATALGFDGIWFGILVVKMIEVGLITPPFGINAYVISGAVPEVSVEDAFRGILWFLPLDVLTIAIIFIFPATVTWLPNLMG